MVDICVGPSELHLKKELTVLRKARYLRDPETCSSWRSPLSSKSIAVTSSFNYENEIRRNVTGENNHGASLEPPSRRESRRKKIYLYNWRHDSSKSSNSGIKLDDDDSQVSVEGSPKDRLSKPNDLDSKSDTYLEVPVSIYDVAGTNSGTPVRRAVKRSRKCYISKKGSIKHSAVTKLLDLPSSSFGILNSVEQSDDTENCNSEDSRHLTHELSRKTGHLSRADSPLFSGSGCGNWSHSSKIWRSTRREGSSHSCTPASTSSYYRYYGIRNPGNVGSWDGSAASYDGDELDQPELPTRQGCGIPCYWSKRTKDRGCGGFYSPSLSDTLRRKGSSILCGSQKLYNKKRSSSSHKQKYHPKSSQGLPLMTNSCDGGGSSLDTASDELSTNFGELDLEALSRLDGRRWSSCKSQEGVELGRAQEAELDIPEQRSLSQKYRPRSFDEVVGQNIVVQSLNNAIFRGRIAPAYLFQGPRGTGKTSIARIFAAALNCLSTEENKPCGFCSECVAFFSGSGTNLREVDATNKKGIDRIRLLVKNLSVAKTFARYEVFVVDECHMLSSKMWAAFMKFIEEPPPRVVFIFITIEPDNLPRAIVSRCQRYIFLKVKDDDIIFRLRKLSTAENLDVELDALDLIALNSDGSLRDAETMLDQLSLLGRKITTSLVNDLVGVVSDEKLLDLLEIAMSSNTAETVRRSRELMDSGVDPMALMSQLAGLIMDIIAGTYRLTNSQCGGTTLGRRSLTDAELERLQQALKILSDAEKQLRLSSERSTWFTAALLQLGSGHNLETSQSIWSKLSAKKFNDSVSEVIKDSPFCKNKSLPSLMLQGSNLDLIPRSTSGQCSPHGSSSSYRVTMNENLIGNILPADGRFVDRVLLDSTRTNDTPGKRVVSCVSPDKLAEIWRRCIQRCHSKTLKELLGAHAKLISTTESEGILIAFIAFEDKNIKSRAERFLSSITNSMEIVLRQNVEVRLVLATETLMSNSPISNVTEIIGNLDKERKVESDNLNESFDKDGVKGNSSMARKSLDYSDRMLQRKQENSSQMADRDFQLANFSTFSSERNNGACNTKKKGQEVSVQRTQTAPTHTDEQKLESAWLQTTERYTPGVSLPKPEKNQVLPQNGVSCQNQNQSSAALAMSSKHWEDELNHEIRALKISDTQGHHKEQFGGRVNHYSISPSLLHSNSYKANFDKENPGHESGPSCNGLFCWRTQKSYGGKVKQGTHGQSQKTSRFSLFGQCGKSSLAESRFRKSVND